MKQRFTGMRHTVSGLQLQRLLMRCAMTDDSPNVLLEAGIGRPMTIDWLNGPRHMPKGVSITVHPKMSSAAQILGFPMNLGDSKATAQLLIPWESAGTKA